MTEDEGFEIVPPDDESGWNPKLPEFEEALKDPDHPHHEDALRMNKEMAEQLAPAIERLRQTVMPNIAEMQASIAKMVRPPMPSKELLDSLGPKISIPESVLNAMAPKVDLPKVDLPKVDLPKGLSESVLRDPVLPIVNHQVESLRSIEATSQELAESLREAAEERAVHQREVDDRASKTLDVLVAMNANILSLNERMDTIDGRLDTGNRGATTAFKWTITVGVLTLVATVAGIIVTLLLSR